MVLEEEEVGAALAPAAVFVEGEKCRQQETARGGGGGKKLLKEEDRRPKNT